ncbi:Gfo/Idh/MocA family protein [Pseudoroseomonas cervicalis]|uniref:Gfo/Idh/MocA family protein n=1 Tax=Teichococcus cervicalis TaxID=204525 RepID=UPI0022F19AA8|nr:Gfo/Idh/MocA family oxidoreductase [Pseudoroseomonas cervicalis]WBV42783.1 Gfo/Idh/MocA family oxidoreductase [Pseudoroseomonas cervicalis]
MSPRPLGFGIIGTGGMAARMAGTLRALPGVQLVGVASGSGRAEAFAARHGIASAHPSAESLLALPGLDAVYVGNANRDHAAAILAAARAGKAVLCEKPFALGQAEGAQVLEAVQRAGILFMEAIAPPFLPAHRSLAERAATQGGPRTLTASFGYPEDPALRPGLFAAGALRDRGIYLLAMALRLCGPVDSLQAALRRGPEGQDREAALLLRHEDGSLSQLTASLDRLLPNEVTLAAPGALFRLPAPVMHPESLLTLPAPPPAAQGGEAPGAGLKDRLRRSPLLRRLRAALPQGGREPLPWGTDPYTAEAAHFAELLRQGATRSPLLPPELSLTLQKLMDQALEGG